MGWCNDIPGLDNEIDLKAWNNQADAPLVWVKAAPDDRFGENIKIELFSRETWEHSSDFIELFGVTSHKLLLAAASNQGYKPWRQGLSAADTNYLCAYMVTGQDFNVIIVREYDNFRGNANTMRGALIVEALTVREDVEDVRSAMHWVRDKTESVEPEGVEELIDTITSPSRDMCNVLVLNILDSLDLLFEFRMVGLESAAHLNGMRGRVLRRHPGSNGRFDVSLENGRSSCIMSENLARIQGSFTRYQDHP
jgi:hypothetical protein